MSAALVPTPTITDSDLPALFQAADKAAIRAQNHSLMAVRLALIFGVSGAVVSTLGAAAGKRELAIAATALLALSLVATLALRMLNWEKDWYGCRAIAESAKSVAWRFMTGADPFSKSRPEPEAEHELTQSLSQILATGKPFAGRLGRHAGTAPVVSDRMRAVRMLAFQERTQIYVGQRIVQQRDWYSSHATSNDRAYDLWFMAVLLAQLAALISAGIFIANDQFQVSLAPLCSAAASALWAWLQAKHFRELASAYGLTAIELGLIEGRARSVGSDQELAAFVSDAENAISREHTMWVARRAGG